MYIITEPYDGSHVRVIAAAKTRESAERQYEREAGNRRKRGHQFFAPLRRVVGSSRQAAHNQLDRIIATWPAWD